MRTLTKNEREKYMVQNQSNYALLDKAKESIFLESDTLESCEDTLTRMTSAHPKYKDMELVKVK